MAKKSKRKPNAAFMKPVQPNATLSEVVGAKPIPRTEVTKKLWAYIKKNGLQDKKNKRMINADDTLQGGVRRQEVRQHVRDDQARLEARQVVQSCVSSRKSGRRARFSGAPFFLRDFLVPALSSLSSYFLPSFWFRPNLSAHTRSCDTTNSIGRWFVSRWKTIVPSPGALNASA